MQAKIKSTPYDCFDPVYDGVFEAPIDTEYNLPDYCPDIQKLLKCQITPEVSSYVVADGVLSCEGICDVRVLYLDMKGDRLRCADFTKEFSATVKLKATQELAVAWVRASMEHVICRAVSARRIDLHASVSIRANVIAQRQELITGDIEEETVEKLKSTYQVSKAINAVSHQFTVEDTVPLKNGKPPIETILRKNACCRVGDCKLNDGSLTLSGSADVTFVYLASEDANTVERMSASLDFSQTIDCVGTQEGCVCDLRACIGECSLQPKEDDVGEYTAVSVLVKIFLTVCLYQSCEIQLVDDAYSVKTPLSLRYGQCSFLKVEGIHSEMLKKKCSFSVSEDGLEKILDIWCEQDSVQSSCDKGKLTYRVKVTVCLLYRGVDGRLLFTEKTFDYTASSDLDDDQAKKSDTQSHTDLWEYRIVDRNTIELSLETDVRTFLSARTPVKYITAAEDDPNAPESPVRSRILVYYAAPGERVWDIAKNHRALLSDLQTQNELYEDTVSEARPILIRNR